MLKQCKRCGETKAIELFYNSEYGKGGKFNLCKDCCRVNPVLIKITSKKCYTCKQEKEVKYFYKSSRAKDRCGNHYKECLRQRRLDQDWYKNQSLLEIQAKEHKGVYLATFNLGN